MANGCSNNREALCSRLSFKQSASLDNKVATSELGFVCDQGDKSGIVGVVLVPFDGTFGSRKNVIPVLFQKNNGQNDLSNLLQRWKNGTGYMFLEAKNDVDELALFLKTNDAYGVETIHIFFPHDLDATPQVSNHIAINVSGFSDGFGAFQKYMRSASIVLPKSALHFAIG